MNMKHPQLDPFARGFLSREDLSLTERIGLGVIELARYTSIDFCDYILPFVNKRPDDCGAWFHFADSIAVSYPIEELFAKYPDEEDRAYIRSNYERIKDYRSDNYAGRAITEEARPLCDGKALWGGGWGGHSNPNFGRIVALGTDGMREYIKACAEKNPSVPEFYRGCSMFLDALDIFGERFHALAEEKAAAEQNPERREKYERAAKYFLHIPKNPARDFEEAVMFFWMVFTFDGPDSPGRLDQYLYPFFEKSSPEVCHDVLSRLWEAFHATRTWNLCISGSDEHFNDESNGLSYAILEMCCEKQYQTPNLTMRVHRNTPEKLWRLAAKSLATGSGLPGIYNDEVVCPALEKIGIPPHDAHQYCLNGCNQIDIMGKSHMGLEDGEVSFGKVLEYTLHNGYDTMLEKKVSIETGDPETFADYAALERAFYRQMDHLTYYSTMLSNMSQQGYAMFGPNPYRSLMIEGCLEKGIDYRSGGPLYNHGQILAEGIADAADSLYAVKKLVFDEKKYTMHELLEALRADFVGYEELRRDFAGCEKFGNDCEAVDQICGDAIAHFFTYLKTIHTYRGGIFTGGCSPYDRAAMYGRHVGALPNGRRKGEALYADSIGAVPGQDRNTPTAAIKSALHYPQVDAGSGFILNLKFDKRLFATDKGQQSFIDLIRAYFAGGGQQVTATVVSREELLDAKKNPEKHGNLIVRVGGYCDYFVNLTEDLQDNVIARTEWKL